ncbi:hypothetical protein [uncultured Sulfitobacter sp.]|uniref:hypothetical protein n=1 Tax=uncultured Sulfitobacter sp. TaxID=191468 RepID=UPI0026234E6B|nr:hypothetical protein [uncultured Sulfitobacter sp.]
MNKMMKPLSLPLLTALLMAPALSCYGQGLQPRIDELAAGMDDFAPSVEELPLDEIADDFGAPDAVASDPSVANPSIPAITQPKSELPKTTVVIIPEGWTEYSLLGLTFAAPAEWQRLTEPDDTYNLAVGDFNMKERRGVGVVLDTVNANTVDEFEDEMDDLPETAGKDMGVDLTGAKTGLTYPDPIIAHDGTRLLRKRSVLRKDDFFILAELIYKEDLNDRGRTDTLMITSINLPEADVIPIIEQLVGTIGLAAAPEPEAQTGVDGLVQYSMPLPKGWTRQFNSADALNFITSPTISASLSVETGYRARTDWKNDDKYETPPSVTRGEIFGHPATIKSGLSKDPHWMDGYKPAKAIYATYLLDQCLADGDTIIVRHAATEKWLASNGFESLMASMSLTLPEDAIACPTQTAQKAPQSVTASGWTGYTNSRFGTSVQYPTSHFAPDKRPPTNGDGRSFVGDAGAEMLVWGGQNALEQTTSQIMNDILANYAGSEVLIQEVAEQGFTLKLRNNGQVLEQRTIRGVDDVLHNVRVLYPVGQELNFEPVAQKVIGSLAIVAATQQQTTQSAPTTDMEQAFWASIEDSVQAASFEAYLEQFPNGVYADTARQRITEMTAPSPKPDTNVELTFWQSIQDASDPAMFQAYLDQWPDGTFAVLAQLNIKRLTAVATAPNVQPAPKAAPVPQPAPRTRNYYTPARSTAERKAVMNTAREPMLRELQQKVIFLVKELRTDGEWYFLMAEPLQPNGNKLDWYSTPYANDWANDAMSDLVMVLMHRQGNNWQVVDYVIGPTDVHWYSWIDQYNLPERLFNPR